MQPIWFVIFTFSKRKLMFYYAGHKSALRNFASNIIFSNGQCWRLKTMISGSLFWRTYQTLLLLYIPNKVLLLIEIVRILSRQSSVPSISIDCRVLEDISDSIVALYTEQGAHFLDLYPSSLSGPDWLVALREKEKQIFHIGLLSSMPNMINNS
ncbi:hypothetical protein POTOM_005208 [Populus tomentosa]|uniref:Uncharacterized protein n=1 Tax=Populus tomentosa TaxID=118781 RepID=A0A8X8AIR7_POPTO|nr:hypothetical protein POTOM_005208 [Populus tomentosa]